MADVRVRKKLGKGRHASAIKRHRESLKRQERNRNFLTMSKTAVKKVREAVIKKDKKSAAEQLKKTIAVLNKVASKGVIPKTRAARLTSRLSRAVNSLS